MEEEMNTKLIDECWGLVFNKLDQGSDWDSISLVCKQFLSITNSLRVSLTVFCNSVQVLSRQLQRFCHLKKIQLSNFSGDLNEAVLQIARSGLFLEELDLSSNEILPTVCLEELGSNLQNLKVLNCSGSSLTDADLVRIANCFLQLEELNIRNSYFPHVVNGKIIAVTDEGIDYLSSRLVRLRKIDLSGNQCISDKSLISLSSNCAFLEKVVVGYSKGVSEFGINFLLQTSRKFTSLVLWAHVEIGSICVRGHADFYRNLQSLRFVNVKISDEFLRSISEAHIQLTELSLSFCKSYTYIGIYMLLRSFRSLKALTLLGAEFLTDERIEELRPYLQSLTSIWLYDSPDISESAFVMLTQSCPLLTRLHMGETGLGRDHFNYDGHIKSSAITYLDLSSNPYLSGSSLRKLLSICPNVEKLNLSKCFQREQLDIADIVEQASQIRSLELNCCRCFKFLGTDLANSKVERLVVEHSGVDDKVLAMIARSCPNLLHLDLEDCEKVTEEGVKEIVRSCQRLRHLRLSACSNVNTDVITWTVTNRPSLRRLVSPSYLYPEEEEQRHFLQLGCLVSKGVDYEEFI